jgi:chorismate mutase
MTPTIASVRARIDALDDQLLVVLAERMQAAMQLKPLKKGQVQDLEREKQVRARWVNRATELGLSPEFAVALLAIVLAESKRLQA